jgi:hypothetical protein
MSNKIAIGFTEESITNYAAWLILNVKGYFVLDAFIKELFTDRRFGESKFEIELPANLSVTGTLLHYRFTNDDYTYFTLSIYQ